MGNETFLLFCFPFAGGTAEFYNDIEAACGESVQFVKLEYSGHGKRMKEPLYHSFFELTDDLYPQILETLKDNPDREYAMMGYSMGSIAMFDILIRIVENSKCKKPWGVFISAHQPKPIEELQDVLDDDSDDWIKDRTVKFGGIDRRLVDNGSFWRFYLPIFKADYQMIAKYEFESIQFKTDIPAVIFYSEDDTPYIQMREWKKYFMGNCDFVGYEGTHFFIKDHYQEMALIIKRKYVDRIGNRL